ncbi:MAG: hypothetical protein JSV45_02000 [Chromatiales bacterium]|nr:MAG: hypothetical protein JSV45_02000 [Chromatiales bacterium]
MTRSPKWRPIALTVWLATAGALGACEPGDQAPPVTPAAARPVPAAMPPADRARAVVAARLNVTAEDVAVISITARDFPDSSLDCPEPDMLYQQVITPGHQVIVEAEGRRFDVRVSGAGARICHRRKGSGGGDPRPTPVQKLAERARADLARHLHCEVSDVTIANLRALKPGDELPGCALNCDPGASLCGYAVALLHDGRRYDYFVNDTALSPCPPIVSS